MEKVGKSACEFTITGAGVAITVVDSLMGKVLPNLRVMVDGSPRYLTLKTTAVRQFPEGEKPAEWKSLITEMLADGIQRHLGLMLEDPATAKEHLWTAYTHESHDVLNCGRIQSVRAIWKMHLHFPGGLKLKVRDWQESDEKLKRPSIIITTTKGKLTGEVSSICPGALEHDFGVNASGITMQQFAMQIRNDYPFLEDGIQGVSVAGWPVLKEVKYG